MSDHYTGELDLQFLRHGKGEYRYPNAAFRFDGEWKSGRKSGQGLFAVEGGSTFEGQFVDGEIEGKGTKTWPDGRRYEGGFSRGEACGDGCFTSPTTGESYTGSWAQNRRHGQGKLVLADGGGHYVGEFQRHRYHGEGQLSLASGFQYSGQFCDGLPHGLGAAIYLGGSTFNGPFEKGQKHGRGGKYTCGVTGICFEGTWAAGKAALLPKKWAIEPDNTDEDSGGGKDGGGDHAKTKTGAKDGKGKKGAKAAPKGAKRQSIGEGLREDNAEEPTIVNFDADGAVAAFWCRGVRDFQPAEEADLSAELGKRGEDSTYPAETRIGNTTASCESGRTLTLTLHKMVADSSPPGSVGAPVSFFVRRPDATDVSESLGRFPTDGLTALFQRDRRNHPKAGKERLLVVPGAGSSKLAERAEPDPPTKGKPADKSKVAGGGEPVGDGGLEARWRTIRSEVESNRCLVIGAGDNFSLKTQRLFESHADTEVGGGGAVVQGGETTGTLDSRLYEQEGNEGGEGVDKEGSGSALCLEPDAEAEREGVMIGQSSRFTVCVDFRIQLDLDALENDVNDGGTGSSIASGDMNPGRKTVSIVSCGERVEVFAIVVRFSTPSAGTDANLGKAGDSVGDTERGDTLAEQQKRKSTLNGRASVSQADTPDVGDAPASPIVTWILESITVRAGSYTGVAPCANPTRERQPCEVMTAELEEHGTEPERKGSGSCDLTSWHGLAVVVNKDDEAPVLWIDGEAFPLSPQKSGGVAGTVRDGPEAASHGVAVVGGLGGEWATLAVKNLAVYRTALDSQNLGTITRVYQAWREERATATSMEALEDERWLEEAKKAAEEEREPEERPEWLLGAEAITSLRSEIVRGEARINKIVLPKEALEGGEWVLRVEDKSHEQPASAGHELSASGTDEEREAFPPLPGKNITLEQAF
ncbi:unnamed protein product [Laminaria digitata]